MWKLRLWWGEESEDLVVAREQRDADLLVLAVYVMGAIICM